MFKKVLLKALQKAKLAWTQLRWAQASFQNQYLCQTNLPAMDHMARSATKTVHCFPDFDQAYDKPPFEVAPDERMQLTLVKYDCLLPQLGHVGSCDTQWGPYAIPGPM